MDGKVFSLLMRRLIFFCCSSIGCGLVVLTDVCVLLLLFCVGLSCAENATG